MTLTLEIRPEVQAELRPPGRRPRPRHRGRRHRLAGRGGPPSRRTPGNAPQRAKLGRRRRRGAGFADGRRDRPDVPPQSLDGAARGPVVSGGLLLDTNIPSELMRPRPEPRVKDWVAGQDIDKLFLSLVSIGELESGFTTMADAERRARLEAWLERHLRLLFGAGSAGDAAYCRTLGPAGRKTAVDRQTAQHRGRHDCRYRPRARPHVGDAQRERFFGHGHRGLQSLGGVPGRGA